MRRLILAAAALAVLAQGAWAETAAPRPSATEPPKKPKSEKPASTAAPAKKPANGAAVYREGGKTCSGLDEYKVCW
ncbi:MAG: hypothetical protein NW215_09130 [Hyphomicrobiales bacterium]|nr:hypothetical protein [Hyphomicrobiales bacterium]